MSLQTEFYINCGIHSIYIDKVIGKTAIPEPKEYNCYFRKRISSMIKSANDGYFITKETDLETLILTIDTDLRIALTMFDNVSTTSDLTHLMIKKRAEQLQYSIRNSSFVVNKHSILTS